MYTTSNESDGRVHELFQNRQYDEIYNEYPAVFNEMLSVTSESEFQDFLAEEEDIADKVFWLFYHAQAGKSLSIGGYEGDVGAKLKTYFQQSLPAELYNKLSGYIGNCHIDMDGDVDFEEQIMECNQALKDTEYSVLVQFDDTYCAGVYFVSILQE